MPPIGSVAEIKALARVANVNGKRLRGCERTFCRSNNNVLTSLSGERIIHHRAVKPCPEILLRQFSSSTDATNQTSQVQDVRALLRNRFGDKVTLANAWKLDNIGNLEFQPRLDNATRHLIQLLQELNWNGHHQTRDTATMVRCKNLLVALLQHDRRIAKDGSSDSMEQCAYRAKAILDNMEAFRHKTSKRPISAERLNNHDLDMAHWPTPDRQVYDLVMKIFRETRVSQDVAFPRTAQAIVQKMEDLYEKTGDFQVKPIHEHWKTIVLCWGKCQDWQRAVYAATETFQRIPPRIQTWKNGRDYADILYHMIMVCTTENLHGDQNSEKHAKSRQLGADVAARIWQTNIRGLTRTRPSDKNTANKNDTTRDTMMKQQQQQRPPSQQQFTPTNAPGLAPGNAGMHSPQEATGDDDDKMIEFFSSYLYQNFLRAIRDLPASEIREALFDDCFALACSQGKVNRSVVKEFLLNSRSMKLKNKYFGPYLNHVSRLPVHKAANELEHCLPVEWTARADRL